MYSQFDLHRLSTEHLATAKPLFIFCRGLFQIHTLQVIPFPTLPTFHHIVIRLQHQTCTTKKFYVHIMENTMQFAVEVKSPSNVGMVVISSFGSTRGDDDASETGQV